MNEDDQRLSLTMSLRKLRAIDEAMDVVESHLERLLAVDEECDEDDEELPERPTLRSFQPMPETRLQGDAERFCRETLMRLVLNPQLDAEGVGVADAGEMLRALDQLRPRLERLQRLGDRASHAHSALSESLMTAATLGYALLESADRHEGLERLRAAWQPRRRRNR